MSCWLSPFDVLGPCTCMYTTYMSRTHCVILARCSPITSATYITVCVMVSSHTPCTYTRCFHIRLLEPNARRYQDTYVELVNRENRWSVWVYQDSTINLTVCRDFGRLMRKFQMCVRETWRRCSSELNFQHMSTRAARYLQITLVYCRPTRLEHLSLPHPEAPFKTVHDVSMIFITYGHMCISHSQLQSMSTISPTHWLLRPKVCVWHTCSK